MIRRISGAVATRSRGVVYGGVVHAVAVSPDKTPSVYDQTRLALAAIDRTLAEAGTDKSRILTATVFLADMGRKADVNRAWDEWVARDAAPMRACIGATLDGEDLVEILVQAAAS